MAVTFDITFPQTYRTLLTRIGFLELEFISINATPLGCVMDLTFHHTLYTRTLGPLVVLAVLYLISHVCHRMAERQRKLWKSGAGPEHRESARKLEGQGSSAIAVALFLVFLLFLPRVEPAISWPRAPRLLADQEIDTSNLAAGTRRHPR